MPNVDESVTMAEHDPKSMPECAGDHVRGENDADRQGGEHASSDPAAAPLGADAEAGSGESAREQIAKARAKEAPRQ